MYSSNAQPTGTNRPRACHPPTTPRPKTHVTRHGSKDPRPKTASQDTMLRVHYPESEPTTHPPLKPRGATGLISFTQENNGSPRYGGHSGRETPGPIPNPEVKPASANGTAPDRMWESRTPPNILLSMGVIFGWPPSLLWGASGVHPEQSPRSERTWQTVVVSRAVGEPRVGAPRVGDPGPASRPGAARTSHARTSHVLTSPVPTGDAVVPTAAAAGRAAVARAAGPPGVRRARATGHAPPTSRGRARSTRSGTTVRRCPRRSPAVSSTAR